MRILLCFLLAIFSFDAFAQEKVERVTAITAHDYAIFLNAIASKDDVHHLYDAKIATDISSVSILKSSVNSEWCYDVISAKENVVAGFLSWFDAARYCNWRSASQKLTQEMESGRWKIEVEKITEEGAYELEGNFLLSVNANATYMIQGEENVDRELHSNVLHFFIENKTMNDGFCEQASGPEATMTWLEEAEPLLEDAAAIGSVIFGGAYAMSEAGEVTMPSSRIVPPRTSAQNVTARRTMKIRPLRMNRTRSRRDVLENVTYSEEEQNLRNSIARFFKLKNSSQENADDHVSKATLLSQQALDAKERAQECESTREFALEAAFSELIEAKKNAERVESEAREAHQRYQEEFQKIEKQGGSNKVKANLKSSAQAPMQQAEKKQNDSQKLLKGKKEECLAISDLQAVAPQWIKEESGTVIHNASIQLIGENETKAAKAVDTASKQFIKARGFDRVLEAHKQSAAEVEKELKGKRGSLFQKIKEGEDAKSEMYEVEIVEQNFSRDPKNVDEFVFIPKSAEEAHKIFSSAVEESLQAWRKVTSLANNAKRLWENAIQSIEKARQDKATWAGSVLALANRGTRNFSLGNATAEEAMALGRIFVGEGATSSSKLYYGRNVTTLISSDGTRRFRSTSWKPDYQNYQANFERGSFSGKDSDYKAPHDGHLLITDVPGAPSKK